MKYLGVLVIDQNVDRESGSSLATGTDSSQTCLPCVIAGCIALAVMVGMAASMVWWIFRLWFG